MNNDTPEAIAITDKAARGLLAYEEKMIRLKKHAVTFANVIAREQSKAMGFAMKIKQARLTKSGVTA